MKTSTFLLKRVLLFCMLAPGLYTLRAEDTQGVNFVTKIMAR